MEAVQAQKKMNNQQLCLYPLIATRIISMQGFVTIVVLHTSILVSLRMSFQTNEVTSNQPQAHLSQRAYTSSLHLHMGLDARLRRFADFPCLIVATVRVPPGLALLDCIGRTLFHGGVAPIVVMTRSYSPPPSALISECGLHVSCFCKPLTIRSPSRHVWAEHPLICGLDVAIGI